MAKFRLEIRDVITGEVPTDARFSHVTSRWLVYRVDDEIQWCLPIAQVGLLTPYGNGTRLWVGEAYHIVPIAVQGMLSVLTGEMAALEQEANRG